MSQPTRVQVCSHIASGLREFGYPDASLEMVSDTLDAMQRGHDEMPHGIVGMFAQSQLQELIDQGWAASGGSTTNQEDE